MITSSHFHTISETLQLHEPLDNSIDELGNGSLPSGPEPPQWSINHTREMRLHVPILTGPCDYSFKWRRCCSDFSVESKELKWKRKFQIVRVSDLPVFHPKGRRMGLVRCRSICREDYYSF